MWRLFYCRRRGAPFWAGSTAERITALEQTVHQDKAAIEQVAVLEEQVRAIKESVDRIEAKLDRDGTSR